MVGVPGRSKACHNCRERKIKCGAERPSCLNCKKSHRICMGYNRKHTFILSKDVVIRDSPSVEDVTLPIGDSDSGTVLVSRWRSNQGKSTTKSKLIVQLPPINDLDLVQIPPQQIFKGQIFAQFLEQCTPKHLFSREMQAQRRRNWMLQALELPQLDPALEHAMLATCSARLGKYNNDQVMVHQSLSEYTVSLRELRRAVLNPVTQQSEQNIAACLALLMYEISECPRKLVDGYLCHYKGAMELLKMKGPTGLTSGLSHSLFQTLRIPSIFEGFRSRQPTYLAKQDWLDLPWRLSKIPKGPYDRLTDILLQMPDLFTQSDRIKGITNPQQVHTAVLNVIYNIQHTESRLTEWFSDFQSTVAGPLYHPELSTRTSATDDPEVGKLFPVFFRFPTFIIAQGLVFYWIARVFLHGHRCLMYSMLETLLDLPDQVREKYDCHCIDVSGIQDATGCFRHFDLTLLPSIDYAKGWTHREGRNICQSVEYFLQEEMRDIGPAIALPPLLVLREHYKFTPGDWSREMAWINEMLVRIRKRGTEVAGSL